MTKAILATCAMLFLCSCSGGDGNRYAMNWDKMNYDMFGTAVGGAE